MRIHHLNGATLRPVGRQLLTGSADGCLVCHCLLIETEAGLVLVDTALGLEDYHSPARKGVRRNMDIQKPLWDESQTMARQVERLGYRREDVRHILLTHLDLDHAGGLSDFPRARVHLYAAEHAAATARASFLERQRYHHVQWAHGPDWKLYDSTRGEPWFGFECVRSLEGLPPEILLVPLVGHTRGHCAVAVDQGHRWLLHAGDAYFFHGEMDVAHPNCPAALRLLQAFLAMNRPEQRHNQERLRELSRAQGDRVRTFCSHDELEWRRLAQESASATSSSASPAARG